MLQPKIIMPTVELDKAFREYAAVTSRGVAEDLNQKSYDLVTAAFSLTKKADKDKIKKIFTPTGKKIIGSKLRLVKKRIRIS